MVQKPGMQQRMKNLIQSAGMGSYDGKDKTIPNKQ
jgi:hypothetical protein